MKNKIQVRSGNLYEILREWLSKNNVDAIPFSEDFEKDNEILYTYFGENPADLDTSLVMFRIQELVSAPEYGRENIPYYKQSDKYAIVISRKKEYK